MRGEAEEYFGNPLFPNCWGLEACRETVQNEQIFVKLASSPPGEVSDALNSSRTALLLLPRRSRAAKAIDITPLGSAQLSIRCLAQRFPAVPALCRA